MQVVEVQKCTGRTIWKFVRLLKLLTPIGRLSLKERGIKIGMMDIVNTKERAGEIRERQKERGRREINKERKEEEDRKGGERER